jgi:uncharacterized protein (TIGR00255 family)
LWELRKRNNRGDFDRDFEDNEGAKTSMSVYSMTAFATASSTRPASEDNAGNNGSGVTVDIRSVNGRFLDLSLRLPDDWRALEPALRESVTKHIKRGKVELRATPAADSDAQALTPSAETMSRLAHTQALVQGWLPQAAPLSVHEALQWSKGSSRASADAHTVLQAAEAALQALVAARAREGERLVLMLRERLALLRTLANRAEPLLPQAVQRQRERFLERWAEALRQAPGSQAISEQTAHERALTEAAAHAIRIDVAEELTRLRSHVDEIERLLAKGGEVGKRLDFLIQELHREANTLGSKSTMLELTAISVDMKVAIEQMREQVQNIE